MNTHRVTELVFGRDLSHLLDRGSTIEPRFSSTLRNAATTPLSFALKRIRMVDRLLDPSFWQAHRADPRNAFKSGYRGYCTVPRHPRCDSACMSKYSVVALPM